MARTIVVADADNVARGQTAGILTRAGFRVVTSSSFEEARVQVSAVTPDLLVADIRLSAFNGLHLVARSLTDGLCRAALVTSAYHDPVLESEAARLGVRFLIKPIAPAMLRRVATEALAGRGPKPWTGVRIWRRTTLHVAINAQAITSARIHDVSYGGLRFEMLVNVELPPRFDVQVGDLDVSLPVRRVWQSKDTTAAVWGGAELASPTDPVSRAWRSFVDRVA